MPRVFHMLSFKNQLAHEGEIWNKYLIALFTNRSSLWDKWLNHLNLTGFDQTKTKFLVHSWRQTHHHHHHHHPILSPAAGDVATRYIDAMLSCYSNKYRPYGAKLALYPDQGPWLLPPTTPRTQTIKIFHSEESKIEFFCEKPKKKKMKRNTDCLTLIKLLNRFPFFSKQALNMLAMVKAAHPWLPVVAKGKRVISIDLSLSTNWAVLGFGTAPFFLPPPQSLRMNHWIYFCWGRCQQLKEDTNNPNVNQFGNGSEPIKLKPNRSILAAWSPIRNRSVTELGLVG